MAPDAGDRIGRRERIVFRALDEDVGGVLLDLDSGDYRQLNRTGALIWQLIEPPTTRGELVTALRAAIDDPPATLDAEVGRFLDALVERGLVWQDPAAESTDPGGDERGR